MTFPELLWRSYIDNLVLWQMHPPCVIGSDFVDKIFSIDRLYKSSQHVSTDETCHVDRILCGTVGRRISKLHMLQIFDAQASLNCHCKYINPFVNSFLADDLSTK